MHAVQAGQLKLLQETRSSHVGAEHALFNNLVSIIARGRTNLDDFAIFTKDHAGFSGFKINRATPLSRLGQGLVKLVQVLQVRQHLGILIAQRLTFTAARMLQHAGNLVVGQPCMGVDHPLVELEIGQLTGLGDSHFTDHRQAINMRIQRTQTVGQRFRQHGNHFTGEVHRGATQLGLFVQRRANRHVVRHVSDGNVKLPAAGEQPPATGLVRLAIERIVKVAGIFTVNGDQRQVAQVDTLELVLLNHVILQALSFLDDCIGPFAGNVVAAQRDFDFHAWRHVVANHFNHLTLGLTTHGRPLGDAHLGVLAVLDAALGVRRNQHVMLNTGVVSNHKANAVFFVIAPHQNLVGTGYHLDNRTFTAAAAIYAGNTSENAVAIKYQAHLRGAEEQVFTAVVRHQKAETVTMPLNPSGDQVQLVDWCIGTAPRVDHLTVTFHGAQASA